MQVLKWCNPFKTLFKRALNTPPPSNRFLSHYEYIIYYGTVSTRFRNQDRDWNTTSDIKKDYAECYLLSPKKHKTNRGLIIIRLIVSIIASVLIFFVLSLCILKYTYNWNTLNKNMCKWKNEWHTPDDVMVDGDWACRVTESPFTRSIWGLWKCVSLSNLLQKRLDLLLISVTSESNSLQSNNSKQLNSSHGLI